MSLDTKEGLHVPRLIQSEVDESIQKLNSLIRMVETLPYPGNMIAQKLYDWVQSNLIEAGVQRAQSNTERAHLRGAGIDPDIKNEYEQKKMAGILSEVILRIAPEEVFQEKFGMRWAQRVLFVGPNKNRGGINVYKK